MIWRRYYELEPYIRCKNDGRDLIGKELVITEKRDGENVSVWFEQPIEDTKFHISSHNQADADENITKRMIETPEWNKILKLLRQEAFEYHKNFILYGELMKRVGATQVERQKKNCHWIIFDIWDDDGQRWLDYNYVYQRAYQFKIPIVKALGIELPRCYEDLEEIKKKWLKWCKRHRREGIVAKAYHMNPQTFYKEKIDLPNLKRMHSTTRIKLPAMPEEKCIRALQHAYDEVYNLQKNSIAVPEQSAEMRTELMWKNKSIIMPIVAKWFSMEAKEHNFEMPNCFNWYINTPLEKVKPNGSKSETASASMV